MNIQHRQKQLETSDKLVQRAGCVLGCSLDSIKEVADRRMPTSTSGPSPPNLCTTRRSPWAAPLALD